MSALTREIRLALPSKGPLAEPARELLDQAGLRVNHPNPRQYEATIPNLPGVKVLFQRPGDVVVSVRDGSVDFGVTGGDVLAEKRGPDGAILVIHPALGFGQCSLNVIVPEAWEKVNLHGRFEDLASRSEPTSPRRHQVSPPG